MNNLHGYDYAVLLKRNQHGGLCEDVVRGREVKRYRDAGEARLFQSMDGQQEAAYMQIAAAYGLRVVGLGAKISKYGEFVGATGYGDIEHGADMLRKYDAWQLSCKARNLSSHMALDVIVFGETLRAVDAKYHFASGTAKKNLLKCLDVWADV